MKILFLISGLLLVFSCKKENDSKADVSADLITSKVKSHSLSLDKDLTTVDGIKQEYHLVNSRLLASELDSTGFKYDCEERAGSVVYYSEKGKLKVIKHFEADSHFASNHIYFVDDDKPYFIFKDETAWSFDGGTPEKPETKDNVTEKRFYIVNDKAIQCLEKKYTIKSNTANNPESQNVPNKELKNCSVAELQKSFDLLVKNMNRREDGKCL